MRKIYILFLTTILLFTVSFVGEAQVVKEFKQRTAKATPDKVIFNLKGDFQMIGNKNLSRMPYSDSDNNGNNMKYVDIDGDGSTINSSSATLQFPSEAEIDPACTKIVYAGLYWLGRAENGGTAGYAVNANGRTLDKRQVKFKQLGDTYRTITADDSNIYFPTNTQDQIYVAYAEVTEYVREKGEGEYFVADMALREGNGGEVGYFGGWGLIVIYENPKMKWRDITIFDGYAYVEREGASGTTTSYELAVYGFKTAQSGDIRIKMGLIAGEGDTGISGDFFEIRNKADNNWERLRHSGNTPNNFFNGSIPASNPRNPNQKNNYGIDIAMFEVTNTNNNIIGNNQTSTKFRYGTTQDTYIIPVIAMAVDAFVPDVRAQVSFISSTPMPSNGIAPGDTVEYKIELLNASNEDILGVAMDIPIPYTATFVSKTATYSSELPVVNTSDTISEFVETSGGSYIRWKVGKLPKASNPDNPPILATLTFKLRATDNCNLLVMDDCLPRVTVSGKVTGKGANSGQNFADLPFITGYESGNCGDVPQYGPLDVKIDMLQSNCPVPTLVPDLIDNKVFAYCHNEDVSIYNAIKGFYPAGSRFYDKVTTTTLDNGVVLVVPTTDAKEYTAEHDFPNATADIGTKVYYVIPFGSSACAWNFTIRVEACSYWVGTNSTDWGTASNWSKGVVPNEGDKVEFATTENNQGNPAIKDLILDRNRTISSLINATGFKTIIPAGKTLIVKDSVVGSDTYAKADKLHIKAAANTPNGSLILAGQPQNKPVFGTVEMYTKAQKTAPVEWKDNIEGSPTYGTTFSTSYRWQYFGVPVESVYADPTFYGAYLRKYDETYNGDNTQFYQKWRDLDNSSVLNAFDGYEITRETPAIYEIKGRLVHGHRELKLTRKAPGITGVHDTIPNKYYGRGQNIFGNSYTAAININTINFPDNVEPTVYIYNTGSFSEWGKGSTTDNPDELPGSYLAIPQNVSNEVWNSEIPSMQGFMLQFKGEEDGTSQQAPSLYTATQRAPGNELDTTSATVEIYYLLPYSYITHDGTIINSPAGVFGNTNPQKAPALNGVQNTGESNGSLKIMLSGAKTSDAMWLVETPNATPNFEYGYDGTKITPILPTATIFAEIGKRNLQVNSTDRIEGSFISFKSNSDKDYTLKIVRNRLDNYANLYLIDLLTRTAVRLDDETVYNFTSEVANHKSKRFMIASTPDINKLNDIFATELLDCYMSDNNTLTVNNMTNNSGIVTIYDMTGRIMANHSVKVGINLVPVKLNAGVYMATIKANDKTLTVKFVIN